MIEGFLEVKKDMWSFFPSAETSQVWTISTSAWMVEEPLNPPNWQRSRLSEIISNIHPPTMPFNSLESPAMRDIGLRSSLMKRGKLALSMGTMLSDFQRSGSNPSRVVVLKIWHIDGAKTWGRLRRSQLGMLSGSITLLVFVVSNSLQRCHSRLCFTRAQNEQVD